MDTKMKCAECDREVGLVEFLTYVEAYFLKHIVPAAIPFLIAAITQKFSNKPAHETKGIIDETMSGLANNFSITCPNCQQTNWYPISTEKPKKIKQKEPSKVI
jgi:hypothetical protein